MPERHKVVPAVMFVLQKGGAYLLHLRARTGYMDDMWSLPGGHVEEGEHVLQTVVREAEEELGIQVDEKDIAFLGMHHMRRKDGNEGFNLYYKITAWKGEPTNAEPEHSDGVQWFKPGQFPANTNPEFFEVIEDKPAHLAIAGRFQPRIGQHGTQKTETRKH